jgi:hypothetical protein
MIRKLKSGEYRPYSRKVDSKTGKRRLQLAAALLLGLGLDASKAAAQGPIESAYRFVTAPPPLIARVGWLAGCWERRDGDRLVEEHWMAPRGAMMLGMGRTVRGDTLVEYEQVRIYERGGSLVYAASPSSQEPAEFVSTTVSDSLAVFENLAHDFPQRVVYRRAGADSLDASVEGTSRGKRRTVRFPYARASCLPGDPAPAPRH